MRPSRRCPPRQKTSRPPPAAAPPTTDRPPSPPTRADPSGGGVPRGPPPSSNRFTKPPRRPLKPSAAGHRGFLSTTRHPSPTPQPSSPRQGGRPAKTRTCPYRGRYRAKAETTTSGRTPAHSTPFPTRSGRTPSPPHHPISPVTAIIYGTGPAPPPPARPRPVPRLAPLLSGQVRPATTATPPDRTPPPPLLAARQGRAALHGAPPLLALRHTASPHPHHP